MSNTNVPGGLKMPSLLPFPALPTIKLPEIKISVPGLTGGAALPQSYVDFATKSYEEHVKRMMSSNLRITDVAPGIDFSKLDGKVQEYIINSARFDPFINRPKSFGMIQDDITPDAGVSSYRDRAPVTQLIDNRGVNINAIARETEQESNAYSTTVLANVSKTRPGLLASPSSMPGAIYESDLPVPMNGNSGQIYVTA